MARRSDMRGKMISSCCISFLMCVVLIGSAGCRRQSQPATSPTTTSFTLDISGNYTIQNPTEADIRRALAGLDNQKDASFLVLSASQMTYIQVGGDAKAGFDLEYQEGDAQHHYRAVGNVTADLVARAMVSYLNGTDDWKKAVKWERMTF